MGMEHRLRAAQIAGEALPCVGRSQGLSFQGCKKDDAYFTCGNWTGNTGSRDDQSSPLPHCDTHAGERNGADSRGPTHYFPFDKRKGSYTGHGRTAGQRGPNLSISRRPYDYEGSPPT